MHHFSLVSFVTDEGSRAEMSQLFVSAMIKFCSLMSTFEQMSQIIRQKPALKYVYQCNEQKNLKVQCIDPFTIEV